MEDRPKDGSAVKRQRNYNDIDNKIKIKNGGELSE